jgi:hypothetical protein
MAGGGEVFGHGLAHDAKAYESDVFWHGNPFTVRITYGGRGV